MVSDSVVRHDVTIECNRNIKCNITSFIKPSHYLAHCDQQIIISVNGWQGLYYHRRTNTPLTYIRHT